MSEVITYKTVSIAASGSVSGSIALEENGVPMTLCGLFTPGAMTGTAISFHACPTLGGTYVDVSNGAGVDLSVTIQTGEAEYIILDPANFAGIRYLQLVSNDTEASARTITLAMRALA